MNRRLTIGLVVVFAALAVYALVVQAPKDKAASATATVAPAVYLWTVRADEINGLHVVDRVKGQTLDLVKDAAGTWSLVRPGPQPAQQALAAADVSSLMTLAVNGTITTSTDLAAFGVLSPTLTVEVDLADGTKLKAAVGDKSPTSADYYALREGETQVVLLSSAAYGTLASLVTSPPVVPPTPTATVPKPGPGTPSVTLPASATVPITTTVAATATTAAGTSTPTQTPPPTLTIAASATVPATATSPAPSATVASPAASKTSTPGRTPTTAPKSSPTP